MNYLRHITAFFYISIFVAAANADQNCGAVIVPTIEQATNDRTLVQSYVTVHAESLFDEFKSSGSSSAGLGGTYGLYQAEYQSAVSSEDFRKKVEQKNHDENFVLNQTQSEKYSTKFLTPEQVAGWTTCVTQNANADGLSMYATNISVAGFSIHLKWRPQPGISEGTLDLTILGGTAQGHPDLHFQGTTNRDIIIEPNNGVKEVIVAANLAGMSNSLKVSLEPLTPPKADIKVTAPPEYYSFIMCSGNACKPGDVPLGNLWPTPFGDCDVGHIDDQIDTTLRVKKVEIISIAGILGDSGAFTISKATVANPGAKNFAICGHTPDASDRRAVVNLMITYE